MNPSYLSKYKADNEQITLRNPLNGRNTIVELWANPIGQFMVRAGANSDFSYTGLIKDIADIDQMKIAIQKHYEDGKLFR